MLKYAKITDEQTGLCEVGIGTNAEFYQSIGMTEQDVCQSSIDGNWYLSEKCPQKTYEQLLLEEKNKKYEENQKALDKARTSHVFTVTLQNHECEFDTTDKTQADLNSAAISASMGQPWLWTTNNRITLSLTTEDIQIVSLAYMQSVNADIAKWTEFEEQIEQAQSVEAVNAIVLDYTAESTNESTEETEERKE